MPWVKFTKDYDWKPRHNVMFSYRAGSVHLVKSAVALDAIARGKAVPTARPTKAKPCQPAT